MAVIKGGKVGSVKKLKASLKKGSSGGYLARVPKDSGITVRFLEEPDNWIEYFEFYDEAEKAYYPLSEGGPEPEGDQSVSKRFLANAVDTADNRVIALVLPKSLAQSLMKKYDKYSTILDRDYELSKDGTGFDTTYDAIPEPPSKMNIAKFEPFDLIKVLEAQLPGDDEDDDDEEEAPKPSRRGSSSSSGTSRAKKPAAWEDEDDEDDDDEPARPVTKKRPVRKPVEKPTTTRKPVRKAAPAAKKTLRK